MFEMGRISHLHGSPKYQYNITDFKIVMIHTSHEALPFTEVFVVVVAVRIVTAARTFFHIALW